jgi:large subunit ribosomal protein L35
VKTTKNWIKQMPKIKTKSGVKKRFRLTASGKVRANQAGKQPQDARIIKKFMPYG